MHSMIYGHDKMIPYDEIATALLDGQHLALRSLILDALSSRPLLATWSRPWTSDPLQLALLAGVVNLLAANSAQPSPDWTRDVPAVSPPRHLMKSAERMQNLRILCETASPEALREKGFFAPPNFLQFA
jgi:hypothetical protein